MVRSIEETSRLLGADGPRWRRMFGPLAVGFDQLADDLLRPILHVPQHPLGLARFSPAVVLPATVCAKLFRTAEAKALFAGNAAHGWYPLTRPTSAVTGFMFAAAGHRYGWPVVQGGTSRIADVLALILADFGGKIETGRCVRSRADLPPADVVLFDLSPGSVADILGDTMPPRVQTAYRRFRFGAAAFKIDLAVEGGIPWTNEHCRTAGTVHVCGSIDEVVAAERDTHAGRMPQRPFIIVAQQYLADSSRSVGELHPVYATHTFRMASPRMLPARFSARSSGSLQASATESLEVTRETPPIFSDTTPTTSAATSWKAPTTPSRW